MNLKIQLYGNPVLREKAKPVTTFDQSLRELIEEMDRLMQDHDGIGLAAPQVGVSLRLFILRPLVETTPEKWDLGPLEVYINPILKDPSKETEIFEEGCLSLYKKMYLPVERPISIICEATDLECKPFKVDAKGMKARMIMHENDHLNGVLIIDRTTREGKKKAAPYLKKMKEESKGSKKN